jgi:hypothetical protein
MARAVAGWLDVTGRGGIAVRAGLPGVLLTWVLRWLLTRVLRRLLAWVLLAGLLLARVLLTGLLLTGRSGVRAVAAVRDRLGVVLRRVGLVRVVTAAVGGELG